MAWHGTAEPGMARRGSIRHGSAQLAMAWHGATALPVAEVLGFEVVVLALLHDVEFVHSTSRVWNPSIQKSTATSHAVDRNAVML